MLDHTMRRARVPGVTNIVPTRGGRHLELDVEAFEKIYQKAGEMGVRIREGYFSRVYEPPDGTAQLYLRDPSGKMVEVNHPDAASLDRSVAGRIQTVPARTADSARARL